MHDIEVNNLFHDGILNLIVHIYQSRAICQHHALYGHGFLWIICFDMWLFNMTDSDNDDDEVVNQTVIQQYFAQGSVI